MTLPRCLLLLVCMLAALAAPVHGQTPAPTANPFADDERAARVAERYKAMLLANPAEGIALDRLWKAYEDRAATAALIEEYRRASEGANQPALILVYGHLLKRAGRLDEAGAAYERAARLDPGSPLPLLAEADLATARSRPADAAALLEQALARLPAADRRRPDLLLKLGDAWLAAGDPGKASAAWEQLIDADPSNFTLRKQLAAAYEKNGMPERAVAHYEYIEQHADPAARAAALRELGRLHEVRGEFDAARDALERGLALTARDNWLYGELQASLIRLYLRAGKAAELQARWEAAVAQNPRDLGGYLRLVALAEANGDAAGARTALEKTVALAPRDREDTLKLARLLADAGEHDRAAALYDALLKLQPGNLDLIFARADLDLQAGRPADAVARIETRVAQNPADETVAAPALQFFLSHRLYDAAEKILRAGVARLPTAIEPNLALAKFYLTQRRFAEARAALDALLNQPGDAAARASRWTAAAEAYKEAGLADEALRCWREVIALQPQSPAPLIAASELLLAGGDTTGATELLQRAVDASPDGPERLERERKLFQALADASPVNSPPRRPPVRAGIVIPSPGSPSFSEPMTLRLRPEIPVGPGTDPHSPEGLAGTSLGRYLKVLEITARALPTVDHWLRLARWQQWAHLPFEAARSAHEVLALDEHNVPAHDLLLALAMELRLPTDAERLLRDIIRLDPTRRADCLKQIAALQMDAGKFDTALQILADLQREAPGSVAALTDLALGQQRADLWFDALATWERAYALPRLTSAQRANLRRPMVAAYEHLGQFQRAAELLQAAVDETDDLAARQDLFHELLGFCQSHALEPWLLARYEARFAAQPQDYFTMTALAELRKSAGQDREAYRLFAQAYYSSPDPAAALRRLVAEAESLGENGEAVAHQRHLVALTGQATADNLEKLAELEDTNLDDKAATRTWEQIAAKFPRDTAALAAAAMFYEGTGKIGRARELLAQVAALDPADFVRRFRLAQLDTEAGDTAGARACLDQILAGTTPEKPGDPLIVPTELDPAADPAAFAYAAGHSRRTAGLHLPPAEAPAADNDERHLRLKVIRNYTRLLFPDNARPSAAGTALADDQRRWLDRWRGAADAGARSEPLAAFFYADQKAQVMDLTGRWVADAEHGGDVSARNVFLLAGLRLGAYPPLAQWAWNDADPDHLERVQILLETLQSFFATGGKPQPEMATELFPATIRSRTLLWQAASAVFAERHWYAPAVELGERALALPGGQTASESLELAQWEMNAGRLDAARSVLRRAIEADGGTSLDDSAENAVFADLRAYYLLLPEEGRPAFAREYLGRVQARGGNPAHAVLAAALLHGLAGDEAAACRDLDRLVDMRLLDGRQGAGSADARRWSYLTVNGSQLQSWNLLSLAAHLWRRGLSEASAFDQQDPETHELLADMRVRLLTLDVVTAADPQEARERVTAYLREPSPPAALAAAATALLGASQPAAAAQIYEHLERLAPGEGEYARNLLAAYDAAGDREFVERLLLGPLDGTGPALPGMSRVEAITRLANLREIRGDLDGARRLLVHGRQTQPPNFALLTALARLLEQSGQTDAAAIWREAMPPDSTATARLALASLEQRRGRTDQAVALLRAGLDAGADSNREQVFAQLVRLYLSTGREGDAVSLAWQWVRDGQFGVLPEVANALSAHGQRPAAREMLATALRHTRDATVRFRLQAALAEQSVPASEPLAVFLRDLRQLEKFSDAVPGFRPQYAMVAYELAVRRGAFDWIEAELKRQWNVGQGDIAAADRLASLYIQNKRPDALREVISQVDHRPNLPEQTLFSLESRLVEAGEATTALPLSERLYRRFPQNATYVLMRARALWKSGQRDEAVRLLELQDAADALRADASGQVAALYDELGERDRARASLERVAARDPLAVRSAELHCRLAALYVQDKRLDDAYRHLAAAYRNPTFMDLGPLVNYLAAAGRLRFAADEDLPGGELPLTFRLRAELLEAVYDRLRDDGQAADGQRWVAAHPELLAAAPTLARTLREHADADALPAMIRLFEDALRSQEAPGSPLQDELAKLYVRQADLAQNEQPSQVLAFLVRANQLQPDDFAVARRLASLYRERKQEARVREVLKPFLVPGALPSENQQAREILGRP